MILEDFPLYTFTEFLNIPRLLKMFFKAQEVHKSLIQV